MKQCEGGGCPCSCIAPQELAVTLGEQEWDIPCGMAAGVLQGSPPWAGPAACGLMQQGTALHL